MDRDAIVKALVKGLEWDGEKGEAGYDLFAHPTPHCRYTVRHLGPSVFDVIYDDDRGGRLWFRPKLGESHPTYEAAQAAAEADYRARIAAALHVEKIAGLVDLASDFSAAKIDALRYSPPYGASPEDEPDPVVDAETVWAWQADVKDALAAFRGDATGGEGG